MCAPRLPSPIALSFSTTAMSSLPERRRNSPRTKNAFAPSPASAAKAGPEPKLRQFRAAFAELPEILCAAALSPPHWGKKNYFREAAACPPSRALTHISPRFFRFKRGAFAPGPFAASREGSIFDLSRPAARARARHRHERRRRHREGLSSADRTLPPERSRSAHPRMPFGLHIGVEPPECLRLSRQYFQISSRL